ncbi:HNH endonuclease signature motif containing protein [Microcoleus sp. N3A4]|uniref:HNH endonuclease signature motif containing protein n=1 Tax=Microcoleus sp. N3A4 TaxID=3055379 RepID=UPI002FD3954A
MLSIDSTDRSRGGYHQEIIGQIPENIQNQVRQRANCLCEYCHASAQWQYVEFTIEHIISLTKNGTNDIDNLALACFHCNRKKSDKIGQ